MAFDNYQMAGMIAEFLSQMRAPQTSAGMLIMKTILEAPTAQHVADAAWTNVRELDRIPWDDEEFCCFLAAALVACGYSIAAHQAQLTPMEE